MSLRLGFPRGAARMHDDAGHALDGGHPCPDGLLAHVNRQDLGPHTVQAHTVAKWGDISCL